jgi:hypothetical protein
MIVFQKRFLTIRWIEECESVCLEWKGFAIGDDFREGLNKGLEIFVEKKGRGWLGDLEQMQLICLEDQKWCRTVWFPQAIDAGLSKLSIVCPRNILAQTSLFKIMSESRYPGLKVAYFTERQKAQIWLKTTCKNKDIISKMPANLQAGI